MEMTNLQDLFVDELKDLYSAESQLVKILPRLAKAATDPGLKKAFEVHTRETQGQIERLERIFKQLDESPRGKKCKAMEGLIAEGKDLLSEDAEPEVLDAGLIAAAQKVEHYEIASYGTVRTYAQLLGDEKSARLLQQTLDEEGNTDKKLTQLAVSCINVEASQGD